MNRDKTGIVCDTPQTQVDLGRLQIQRIIRLAGHPGVLPGQTVHQQARAALTRLDRQLHASAAGQADSEAPTLPSSIIAGQA